MLLKKKHLHIIILLLLLTSCRTRYIAMPEIHRRDSLVTHVNTRVDSIREKDSISFSFTEIPVIFYQRQIGLGSERYDPRKNSGRAGGEPEGFGEARFQGGAYRSELPAISDSVARVPTIHHWHTRTHDRMVTHTDTVTTIIRDSIPYPVEVPIEVPTPIPRFYIRCTIGFWLIILGFVLYIAARLYLHR